ncbi:MAG: hypothetical protein QXN15_09700 [Candidatus Jordarchaeales archaeon]|nr:hypothetical protein [Candidatus Jordarchaeia archaeon]
MGLKGRIAFHFMADKINLEAYISLLVSALDYILEVEKGDVNKASQVIWNMGRKIGSRMLAKYAERVGKHAIEFYEFSKTYNLAYYFYLGKSYDKIYVVPEEKKIVFEDYDCPVCRGVLLPDELKGVRLCNIIDGIYTEVCTVRGFDAESWETKCKASGDECCRHELRLKV